MTPEGPDDELENESGLEEVFWPEELSRDPDYNAWLDYLDAETKRERDRGTDSNDHPF